MILMDFKSPLEFTPQEPSPHLIDQMLICTPRLSCSSRIPSQMKCVVPRLSVLAMRLPKASYW